MSIEQDIPIEKITIFEIRASVNGTKSNLLIDDKKSIEDLVLDMAEKIKKERAK